MIPPILVQQQDDVVLQSSESESAQKMNSRFGGDLRVVEDPPDEHEEDVAQGPTAVAQQQILVELFQRELLVFRKIPIDQFHQLFQLVFRLKFLSNYSLADGDKSQLTSISLNTIGGSRFFFFSSSTRRSSASSSNTFSDGNISEWMIGVCSSAAPLVSSISDMPVELYSLLSLNVTRFVLFSFFRFFSFLRSFFAILSRLCFRRSSSALDCSRSCSICVLISMKSGDGSRVATVMCGSKEKFEFPSAR